MAKPPIKDLTLWYDQLNFFPPEDKNKLWLAQGIFYAKLNGVQFLDPKRKKLYRNLEKGIINEQEYKQLIDPITSLGGGGKAEYFASDWKTCPIDIHLENIARADLDKIGFDNKLQVNEIDKFSKPQRQKDRDKIIYQREFKNLINEVNQMVGLPPIKNNQTPYAYVASLSEKDTDNPVKDVEELLDYIKNKIGDDPDLLILYETYIYKGDVERCFEMGFEHYIIKLNKWRIKASKFNNDIKNFNKFCGRYYIDETNGRGMVEYLEPDYLNTSPFVQENGEDISFWTYEYTVPFSEFVRMFGQNLDEEQLKEVFDLNRNQGGNHGMTWTKAGSFKGSNAAIQIGIYSVLTQDADKFAEKYVNGKIPVWKRKPLDWMDRTDNRAGKMQTKIYNVWYSCYYIPPPGSRTARNMQADWAWQSQFIFNVHKDIDMYRFGVDDRYAKSTLVVWKDDTRMSFTDIKEAFMPKIRTTWHKFQNCLVQDTTALIMSKDFLGGILKAVDEQNKINPGDPDNPTGGSGLDASVQAMKMVKQGGMAFLNFRDKNGNLILDPSKLFVPIDTKHLDKAERYLKIIMEQYQMMSVALAQNDITEGQNPKPRTPVEGIQQSLEATKKGFWFLEKPARECLIMFGERCAQYMINLIKEKNTYNYTKRWEELANVIGKANSLILEGIQDLHPEEIGFSVDLEDVRANQQYIIELANKMADDGEVGREVVSLVMNQAKVNYKYAYVLLMVAAKQKQKELAQKEELEHERQMELKDQDLKIAQALTAAKGAAKDKNIQTQGAIDSKLAEEENKLKSTTLSNQKEQLKNNKIAQDNNKARLEHEHEIAQTLAPTK